MGQELTDLIQGTRQFTLEETEGIFLHGMSAENNHFQKGWRGLHTYCEVKCKQTTNDT